MRRFEVQKHTLKPIDKGKIHNLYAMQVCLTCPRRHTKCIFLRNAILVALLYSGFIDYQYTKIQQYTSRVQKFSVFVQVYTRLRFPDYLLYSTTILSTLIVMHKEA